MLQLPPLQIDSSLRLRLEQVGDRLHSAIDVTDRAGLTVNLLSSLEGDAESPWPLSPPFQDAQQMAETGNIIFATGRAGSGHWSAAIELDHEGRLCWDVACRYTKRPKRLGSVYQWAPTAELRSSPNRLTAALAVGPHLVQVTCLPWPGQSIRLVLDPSSNSIGVTPDPSDAELPATVRWRYQLSLHSDSRT